MRRRRYKVVKGFEISGIAGLKTGLLAVDVNTVVKCHVQETAHVERRDTPSAP